MTSKSSEKTESRLSCEELYIANEKLVYQCLRRNFPDIWMDEDIQQDAKIALWRACVDYDPKKGAALSTLAWTYIRFEIFRLLNYGKCEKRPKNIVSLSDIIYDPNDGSKIIEYDDCLISTPDVDWCDSESWWNSLTARQRQILKLRINGATTREMEKTVGVSRTTIAKEIIAARKQAEKYL